MEVKYRQFFENLKYQLANGLVTYDEAKIIAQPMIDELNAKRQEIAKKHGKRKTYNLNFIGLIR